MPRQTIFRTITNRVQGILTKGMKVYCKQRQLKKMIRCTLEMDALKNDATHMAHQLKMMCFNELCFCVPNHFLTIMRKINEWERSGDEQWLIEICNVFCKSELSALPRDIHNYFWNPEIIEGLPDLESDPALVDKYKKEGDKEVVLKLLANFIGSIANENEDAFEYAFAIMKLAISGVKGAERYGHTSCDYIIWEVLLDKIGSTALYAAVGEHLVNIAPHLTQCVHIALKEYSAKKNQIMTTAILWVMHKNKLDWSPPGWWVEESIDWSKPLNIDDLSSGDYIINENQTWLNEKYREHHLNIS